MSQYEAIRTEFHDLQRSEELTEIRINTIEVVDNGHSITGANLPGGLNGVCIYWRKNDNTRICEEAFMGGAVDGCARYFNRDGELVGEDYYDQGGVTQTRVFK